MQQQLRQPIKDTVKEWEVIAAKEYQFDGVADGWDSDEGEVETSEQKYIKVSRLQTSRSYAYFNFTLPSICLGSICIGRVIIHGHGVFMEG